MTGPQGENTGEGNFQTVSTDDLDIDGSDLVASGDFILIGPSFVTQSTRQFSTTSTSYTQDVSLINAWTQWDVWRPTGAQTAIRTYANMGSSTGDIRLQNNVDSETVHEQLDVQSGTNVILGPTNYTPATAGSPINFLLQIRTNDGGTSTSVGNPNVQMGVQL